MKKVLLNIPFLLFLLAYQFAFCQVKFTASATPNFIHKNEYAQLRFVVENADDVQKIIPPELKDFTIVGGPSQESSTSIINNVIKKYTALVYYIKPNSAGRLTIPPATAIVDGKTLKSNSTVIEVSNSVSKSSSTPSPYTSIDPFAEEFIPINDNVLKEGESAMDKVQKNMFIKVDVDKTSCYIGEPVVVTYKLYTRLKSESILTKNPSFNGFSVIDLLQANNNYTRETVNGKEYNVYIIRKAQLYPLQSGDIEIEKAEVENTIHFIKEDYAKNQRGLWDDLFNDFSDAALPPEAIEDHKVVLQSKPVYIKVHPLPAAGKPVNFKGAVGNFTIKAQLNKNNFTTDESGKLFLTIEGEGNIQLLTAPNIAWPNGMDGYDPAITNNINKFTVPASGKILYEYNFTVDNAGEYTIPSIPFTYFDIKSGSYKTTATQPLHCTIIKSTTKKDTVSVAETGSEHFFNRLFSNRWWIILAVAAFILTGLIIWLKREAKKDKVAQPTNNNTENTPTSIATAPQNWLAEAEEQVTNMDTTYFYTLLNTALKKYLSYKINIADFQLDKKTISDYFNKKNTLITLDSEWQKLLEDIEWQLYAPLHDTEQRQILLVRSKDLIRKTDLI